MAEIIDSKKISIVKDKLKRLTFLHDHGFELSEEGSKESAVTGKGYNFIFRSPNYKRTLKIWFDPEYKKFPDYFAVFIFREKKHVDLQGFLKLLGVVNDGSKFMLKSYPGSFEEQVEDFCQFLEASFETNWKDVLLGEKWAEIPVDWGDYK